jgi:D-glycero-alpha-D-manno-heptose-7-phosphate kinase
MIVEATAPSRIDLAGGTLDIYPLYLFEEGGITVNLGTDVGSRARVSARADEAVTLTSVDTGAREEAPELAALRLGGPLDLVARILRFYRPTTGVDVEVENRAPRGSGLGASSSLLIALSGALNALNGTGFSPEEIISFGADLEAQNIRIPTGKQDYYAAMHGGVNAIWFDVGGNRVEPLLVDEAAIRTLESRLILSFTGISHFSGATNWDMLRNYIEGTGETRRKMAGIKRTALAMREVLLANDFGGFAEVLNEEWENRRGLADGVSTPQIDAMIEAASRAGAVASKICGAGGGGCMVSFAREGRQEAVIAALSAHGARHLPYRISRQGLTVRVLDP